MNTALQQSLLSLVNNSTDYMATADKDGNVLYMNLAGRKLVGLDPTQNLAGLNTRDYLSSWDLEKVTTEVLPCVEGSGRWTGRLSLRHLLTSEVIPCQASFIRIDDPETSAYIGRGVTLRDLRPEINARQALSTSEQQLRMAVELAQLGTWSIDLSTMTATFSKRSKELYGFTGDEVSFADGIMAIDEDDRDRAIVNFQKSLDPRNGGIYEDTYAIRNLITGRQHAINLQAKVYFNEKNEAWLIAGTLQDITEQKTAEKDLEDQVQRRTEELNKANSNLSRSNQELEQFAFIASHDLQEPLRKIRIFSGLLEEKSREAFSEEGLRHLSKIRASAERMDRLIRDLLEFSRVNIKNELRVPVDLNEVIRKVLDDFDLAIKEKRAMIHAQQLPVIEAIPLQMNQLFYNLIGNALKFSRPGVPPLIQITARRLSSREAMKFSGLEAGQLYWAFEIADNGIGFDPSVADKIFTIFQRLNTRDKYEGTGIGLALCRKIVNAHEGLIFASSEKKAGAVFHLFLPVKSLS
ncbi:MAG TPA: ATP-binding protein [Puia sp.]|nr:ATP-binding protein [Puia sp.]